MFFFLYCYCDHGYLHSFPTRRSSDLLVAGGLHAERPAIGPCRDVDLAAGERGAGLRVARPELGDVRLHLAQALDDGRRIVEAPAQLAVNQPRDGEPVRRGQVRIEHGTAELALGHALGELDPALRRVLDLFGVVGDAVAAAVESESPAPVRLSENGQKAGRVPNLRRL